MMYEFFLALRYLKPRRNAVSVITLTSILGVTLGVAVLIIVMAVMTGFTAEFKNKLIETQSHFQIRKYYSAMNALDRSLALLKLQEHGAVGTPVIQGPVLVQYGYRNRKLDTQVMLFAAPEKDLRERLHLEKHLKKGQLKLGKEWGSKAHYAVISSDMAQRWQLNIGEKFLVHSTTHLTNLVKFNASGGVEINQESSAYLPGEFIVAGIYSLGKSDFDRAVFFVDPDDAADLFDLPWGAATAIYGWGPDAFNQQKLLHTLSEAMPGFAVIGWEEAKKHFAYVRPIMIMAGLDGVQRRRFHSNKELTPEADYIHEAYKHAQRVFRKTCSISSTASFYRVFSSFKEHGISSSDRISDALRANDRLIFPMASQVLRHNPPGTFCPVPK